MTGSSNDSVEPPLVCVVCGEPTVMTVNATGTAVGACSAHFFEIMDREVATLAAQRGVPMDVARKLMAKAIRGALGQ